MTEVGRFKVLKMFILLLAVTSTDVVYNTMELDYIPSWVPNREGRATYHIHNTQLHMSKPKGWDRVYWQGIGWQEI